MTLHADASSGLDDSLETSPTSAVTEPAGSLPDQRIAALVEKSTIAWSANHHLIRRLGAGGQGIVYLADRLGADGWEVPVAIKFFSPAPYPTMRAYVDDMARIAQVLARVAVIQQDHLLHVHNFVELDGIRVMSMEWVDGYDLQYLLAQDTLTELHRRVPADRSGYLNDVVITSGPEKSRLKSGVAIAIVQECLGALAALHRDGIVHGDLKPANIMLKKTGNTKIIDLGSACSTDYVRGHRPFTPQYAPPEVLQGGCCTPFSDLASLGYVLVEMLAGRPLFSGITDYHQLLDAKHRLVDDLPELLPQEVLASESLMHLARTLVAPEPEQRHPSEEAADLMKIGAAYFQRELITGDLASEYESEIRLWLKDLGNANPSASDSEASTN
jgi:serine/threonine-protein kinase